MSRMVRENQVSGLRERQWFAQLLLNQLIQRQQQQGSRGELLALRGAVLFHLYSALVGMARNTAQNYGVTEAQSFISLSAICHLFAEQQVSAPEIQILESARSDHADLIYWLEQEVMSAHGASGLARRPVPPSEQPGLGMVAEDPYAMLAEGDLQRLKQLCARVQQLLEQAAAYMEEW